MKRIKCLFRLKDIPKEKLLDVEFDLESIPPDEECIRIDPKIITEYWKRRGWYLRSENVLSYNHTLPFDVDVSRIKSIISAVVNKIKLPPVELSLSSGKRPGVCFPDGRHRIALFSLVDLPLITAQVKINEATKILGYLGALETKGA